MSLEGKLSGKNEHKSNTEQGHQPKLSCDKNAKGSRRQREIASAGTRSQTGVHEKSTAIFQERR